MTESYQQNRSRSNRNRPPGPMGNIQKYFHTSYTYPTASYIKLWYRYSTKIYLLYTDCLIRKSFTKIMRMKEKNIFSVIEQEIFFRIFLASDFITLKTALLVNFFTYFSVCIILCFTDFGFAKTVIKYSSTKNLSAV